MRWGFVLLVVLLAAAGVWFLFSGDGPNDAPYDSPGADGSRPDVPEHAPELMGSGDTRPRVPTEIRGRGMLQGMTRRAGVGTSAEVELRHVVEIDPKDPFRGGLARMFIERMLDSGISGKPVIARTRSDEDGRFRFKGLAPGLYEVRAISDGGALGLTSAMLPAAGARVEVNVDLPDGDLSLKGRVVYANEKPYRGLVVLTTGKEAFSAMMGGAAAHVRPAQSGEDGRFEIPALSPGRYQLSAIIPGHLRVMGAPLEVPYEGEYLLTINAAGVTIRGKVQSAETEQPIAAASVFGGGGDPSTSFSIFSTTSAADGTFEMTIPGGGGGGMFVRADGYAPQMVELRGATGEEPIVVSMLALGRLSGHVTQEEGGEPVGGLPVFAVSAGGGIGFGGNQNTAVTDADGRYAFPGVPPGSVKLYALGAGWVSVGLSGTGMGERDTPYVAEVEPGQAAVRDLEVGPAGRVRGRALDAGGHPVAGAVIQAGGGSGMARALTTMLGMGLAFGSAVTDGDGAFEIDALVPGMKYKLTAKAPEEPDAESEFFTVEAGQRATIDIAFPRARWFQVQVLNAVGGKPVAGATIVVQPKKASGGGLQLDALFDGGTMWMTDGTGIARVGPLAAGELHLRAVAPGYAEDGIDVTSDQDGDVRIELRKGLVLAGSVQLPEGIPVQSVRVTIQRDAGVGGSWLNKRVAVGADGTWRIDSLKQPGAYRVSARGDWNERRFTARLTAEAGSEDVVLDLQEEEVKPGERFEILVTDADGKPVPTGQVSVTRYGGGGSSSYGLQLNAGKAGVRGFQTDGELWVEVYGLVGRGRGSTLEGPLNVVDGKVEIRLPRPQTIAGVVRDEDGHGIAGVKIQARPKHPREGTDFGNVHAKAVSDGGGHFTLKRLGPYAYSLGVEARLDFAPVQAVEARAGATNVLIQARHGLKAALTLLDYAGTPVVGARVQLEVNSPKERGGRSSLRAGSTGADRISDGAGVLTLRGLPPDRTFQLTITGPSERKDLQHITVKDWTPADDTFSFERGYVIAGKIITKAGRPAEHVRLRYRKQGARNWTFHWVREAGSFELLELDPGLYELRAEPRGAGMVPPPIRPSERARPDPNVQTVRAGTQDVKLVVDLGATLTVKVSGLTEPSSGPGPSLFRSSKSASLRMEGGANTVANGSWTTDDTVMFRGLDAEATYRLWIGGLPGGKYVRAGGIRAQAAALVIQAQTGGTIHGRVKLPTGASTPDRIWVSASNGKEGISVSTSADVKAMTFTLEGLPEGLTFDVIASVWGGEKGRYQGTVQARTGGDIEISLTKR